jgi:Zn-dependent protease
MTVLANFVSGILLIVFAFRQKLSLAGWLFLLNLVCVFALNGLARISQTILIHWVNEGINTLSCLGFMIAGKIVYEYAREHFGVDPSLKTAQVATTG